MSFFIRFMSIIQLFLYVHTYKKEIRIFQNRSPVQTGNPIETISDISFGLRYSQLVKETQCSLRYERKQADTYCNSHVSNSVSDANANSNETISDISFGLRYN